MNKINKDGWYFKWLSMWSSDLKYKNSISSCYLVWQTIWSIFMTIFGVFAFYCIGKVFLYCWINLFIEMPDKTLIITSWIFNGAFFIIALMISYFIWESKLSEVKEIKEVKKREYVLIKSIVGMVKKFCFKIDIIDNEK